jgi:excisionase family DNA binding protein
MEHALLSTKDVCARLGVDRSTVYRMVKAGKLAAPIQFSARMLRWRASDVEAAIDATASAGYDPKPTGRHAKRAA